MRGAAEPAEAAVQRAAERLRAAGERMTAPRRAVLRALAERGGHVGAEEVVAAVAASPASSSASSPAVSPGAHRATVYRTLETLSALGVVSHVHLGHGPTAYHLAGAAAHVHAQCRACGRVVELPADLLDGVRAAALRSAGFVLEADHVALSGTCADCAAPGSPGGAAGRGRP